MLTALIALGIFGTILLLMQGGVLVYRMMAPRGADRAVERVQTWSTREQTAHVDLTRTKSFSSIPWLNDLLMTVRRLQSLRVLHRQADCRVPLGTFVLVTPLLALSGFLFVRTMDAPFVLALLAAAIAGALPVGYLYWLKNRRMAMFERQLPEALELVSRALRAGHAFSVGLKLVGDEAADPIASEFKRVSEEVSMGVGLPQALQNMTDRLDSLDVRFFVTSVLVQRETGGNLAEIIDSLAGMIRMRFELQLKVRALSAEGRYSGILLFCLPIVVALLLNYMNPEYMGLLFTDPIGRNLVMVGSSLMVLGAIIMQRMVIIKV